MAPTLETDRLLLRPFKSGDLNLYHAAVTDDEEVMARMEMGVPLPLERSSRLIEDWEDHWEIHGFGVWALTLKDGALLGHCGLLHEPEASAPAVLTIALARAQWGKGYGSEGAHAALRFGFEEAGLERIGARCTASNSAAIRMLRRLNMSGGKTAHEFFGVKVLFFTLGIAEFKEKPVPYRVHR